MLKNYEQIRLELFVMTEDIVTASQGINGAENDYSDPFN